MFEKWKLAVENNAFGATLTFLSKAFDCLRHDLLTTEILFLSSIINVPNQVIICQVAESATGGVL